MSSVPKRRNGLTLPYTAPQVSAWIALLLTLVHFLVLCTPLLPSLAVSIPLTIVFCVLIFIVLYFGLRCCAIDAMDPHLARALHLHAVRQEEEEDAEKDENSNSNRPKRTPATKESTLSNWIYKKYNPSRTSSLDITQQPSFNADEMKQCWICDVQVHEQSMHCKYCNKCVGHFDHHCMWLNTCIGDRNYRDFFRVMLSIFCMQIMHLSISAYLCVDLFLKGPTYTRANDVYGDGDGDSSDEDVDDDKDVTIHVITALLLFFMIFDVISLILLSQLIHFHIGLQRDNISTYQYIVRDHQRRRDATKMENELQAQRVVQMQKLRTENRHCAARKLRVGHACRNMGCPRLDPMKLPSSNSNHCPEATTNNNSNAERKAVIVDDVAAAAATTTTNGNGAVEAAASPKPTTDVVPFAESLGAFPSPLANLNNDDYSCDDTTANGSSVGGGAVAAATGNEPTSGATKSSSSPRAVQSSQPSVISWQPTAYSQFNTDVSVSASSSSTSSSLMQHRVPSLHHATLLAPDDEDDDLTNCISEDDDTNRSGIGGVSFIKVNAANSSSSPPSSSSPCNVGLIRSGSGGASSSSLATGSQHLRKQEPTIIGATTTTTAVVSDAPPPPSSPTSYSTTNNVKPLPSLSPPR